MKLLFFAAFLFVLGGCNRPMKDPQLMDPVYIYFIDQITNYKEEVSKIQTEIDKLKELADKAEPQTGQRREYLEEMFENKKKLSKTKDNLLYFEHKLKEREVESKRLYKKAYEEKREWPDKNDYEMFEIELKLHKKRGKDWPSREWFYEKRIRNLGIERKKEIQELENKQINIENKEN
ncbi:MAG: hypothetical protein IPM57_04455 [Oligoflexia bacterium]|nr:hypothetical protein [Oligoflexia bacterium]